MKGWSILSILILPLIFNVEANNDTTQFSTDTTTRTSSETSSTQFSTDTTRNDDTSTSTDITKTSTDSSTTTNGNGNKDFDFLIFTQLWPTTDCVGWRNRRQNNTCFFDVSEKYHLWTIHGIWPSSPGSKGPFFCNDSYKFDYSKIKPLVEQLEIQWPNVHKNTELDEFWEHEWNKHGTCAMQLEQIKDEFDFFNLGLKWNALFNIGLWLTNEKIIPGANYSYDQIQYALKVGLGGSNPSISCVYDHKTKNHLINQIEICLNKDFTLRNCDDVYGGLNQGCPPEGKKIFYPKEDSVPHSGKVEGKSLTWKIIMTVVIVFSFIAVFVGCFFFYKKRRDERLAYQAI